MLSIIIPILNEETILKDQADYFSSLAKVGELIFVDGGSEDLSATIAGEYGQVVFSSKGRGIQKHAGAQAATGDHFLFLHVDTIVNPNTLEQVLNTIEDDQKVYLFRMIINDSHVLFRFFERVINQLAQIWKVLDADLGLLVSKQFYQRINGIPQVPIMEDLKLRQQLSGNQIQILDQFPIKVSSRRWREQGFGKTFWLYTKVYFRFFCGF